MKMQDGGKPLNNLTVSKFEEQLKIRLPQDYQNFMLENNGGMPEKDWSFDFIEVGYRETSSIIQEFFVIYTEETDEYDDLKKIHTTLQEEEQVPPNILPIATDPGGNLICLCVSDEDYGKVYFCNHELEDPESGYMVLSLIANSFSEFIDNCYEYVSEE